MPNLEEAIRERAYHLWIADGQPEGQAITNIRNTSSPHWRGWLKPENRCLVPLNSFAEYAPEPNPETKKIAQLRAQTSEFDPERTLPQWAYRAPLGFDLKH